MINHMIKYYLHQVIPQHPIGVQLYWRPLNWNTVCQSENNILKPEIQPNLAENSLNYLSLYRILSFVLSIA